MIPAEAVSLYLVGSAIIPTTASPFVLTAWAIVCLIAVIVVRVVGTKDPTKPASTDWAHVVISCIAFLVWLYTLGGLNAAWHIQPQPFIGSLLTFAFTFFAPFVYKGPDA
jgi:hypothetical protein